ncbi:hypothetical protein P3X46_007029 [Hevea brasiliensis]|uniref:DUF4283 domain-containing protein n=1 Tax=Hevea brasiliensis TaxID=3981 RepID=A0ABQ9MT61_HEVBR|nr:uncharacterized protein LOC131179433 [Hevea brasiliensis]KAJ9183123.1 hypothetical protein P3X46_007029 [Hevea brasiliensis]
MKSWKKVVVVRMLGRYMGYKALSAKLQALWHSEDMKILELGNDFFLVRFTNEAHYCKALMDGSWIILGSYFLVQPWTPDFSIHKKDVNNVVVWIRLPGLPLHLYKKKVLRAIGDAVGNVVKVDYMTSDALRGKYATIAVTVNLNEPLLAKF